jgi:hypothetical protein
VFEQLFETLPSLAAVMATPVVPFEHNVQRFMVVPLEAVEVAEHPVVVEVASKLCIEDAKELLQSKITTLFAPLSEVSQGSTKLLRGCAPNHHAPSPAIDLPVGLPLGSDQAVRSGFHHKRAREDCFYGLNGPFPGQNGHSKLEIYPLGQANYM